MNVLNLNKKFTVKIKKSPQHKDSYNCRVRVLETFKFINNNHKLDISDINLDESRINIHNKLFQI